MTQLVFVPSLFSIRTANGKTVFFPFLSMAIYGEVDGGVDNLYLSDVQPLILPHYHA